MEKKKKQADFTVLTNRPPQLHEPHLFSEIAAYKCTGGGGQALHS